MINPKGVIAAVSMVEEYNYGWIISKNEAHKVPLVHSTMNYKTMLTLHTGEDYWLVVPYVRFNVTFPSSDLYPDFWFLDASIWMYEDDIRPKPVCHLYSEIYVEPAGVSQETYLNMQPYNNSGNMYVNQVYHLDMPRRNYEVVGDPSGDESILGDRRILFYTEYGTAFEDAPE